MLAALLTGKQTHLLPGKPTPPPLLLPPATGFHRAFHAFDRWLIDQITSGALHWDRSGCTAVAGVCCGEELLVGHVGDSSALLVDMEGHVTRLTENHNTFNEAEVERVRASGALVEFSRGCPVPRVWDRPPHLGGRGSMVTRWVGAPCCWL
jgi:serine/threonine protein phosphatase PrpC